METDDRTVYVNPEKENREASLERLYAELGKAYYEGGFEDPLPQLLPLFEKITSLRKEMERGPARCPQCGSELREDAVFCGQCGYRIR